MFSLSVKIAVKLSDSASLICCSCIRPSLNISCFRSSYYEKNAEKPELSEVEAADEDEESDEEDPTDETPTVPLTVSVSVMALYLGMFLF